MCYYPYGATRSGTVGTDYRYTGQRAENVAGGKMDYRARYYDTTINRFLQPDSIVPETYNPQDYNRYSYVRNNPLIYTDPSGHCIFGVDTAVCVIAAVSGLVNLAVDYTITTQVLNEEYSVQRGIVAFGTGAVGGLIGGALIPQIAQGVGSAVMVNVATQVGSNTAGIVAGVTAQAATDIVLSGVNNAVWSTAQRVGQQWVNNEQVTSQSIYEDFTSNFYQDYIYGAAGSIVGQSIDLLGMAYLPEPGINSIYGFDVSQPGLEPLINYSDPQKLDHMLSESEVQYL